MRISLHGLSAVLVALAFAFAARSAQAVPALPENAAQELLDADRQFSTDAASKNVVNAIGDMLAPNAMSPAPGGVFAKSKEAIVDLLKTNPNNLTGKASWTPVRVGISADGLQGFTYGFMTLHNEGIPDRRAKYLAYWVKRPEGWRVFGYKRAGSPPGAVSLTLRAPALPPRMIPDRPSVALSTKYRESLAAREAAFSARAQVIGLGPAFLEFGSADAMNFGGGSDMAYGPAAIAAPLGNEIPSPVTWGADEGATTSSTGDLGITFGYIRPRDGSPPTPFFTIWRRNLTSDPWLYVAE